MCIGQVHQSLGASGKVCQLMHLWLLYNMCYLVMYKLIFCGWGVEMQNDFCYTIYVDMF